MDGCDENVQNLVPSTWDINEIVRLLRQERLFVLAEQQELQSLNEQVAEDTAKISQSAWVTTHQRVNLNKLIVSRPDCSPAACCQRANSLESTLFVDANKILQYQDVVIFAEFLRALRLTPELVAQCLVVGEKSVECAKFLPDVVQCLVTGLYGNLILPDDTLLVLQLLRQLAKLQLSSSDNPRRLLKNGSCAFSRLYSTFHEGLFSAKLFLTATLQGPIMHLLTETENYYEIDPNKALIRLSTADRIKKFGREGTPEFANKMKEYRKWTIQNLVNITTKFIVSLQENIHCFPKSVCWLIKHIASMLNKCGTLEPKEVNAMCTDLIFTHFICLAIVNPEVYGVCDAPISPVARFNLMQVGRILQMLSLMKYQEPDPKLLDLYNSFDQNSVSALLEGLLNEQDNLEDGPISVNSASIQGVKRTSALFTCSELQSLVSFLQNVYSSLTQEQAIATDQGSQSSSCSGSDAGFPVALRDQLGMLISGLPTTVMNGTHSPKRELQQNGLSTNETTTIAKRAGILGKVSKNRLNRASSSPGFINHIEENSSSQNATIEPTETVLIIPLLVEEAEHIGLLTEQKVLSMAPIKKIAEGLENMHISNSIDHLMPVQDCEERDRLPDQGILNSGQEKRTRFSHSHDEGSIGNTSDNLEAISEAASNHSVASSLELENEDQNDNDNLSDMVSANVSGRGTPNISGRDTPSSQVTEGEERQLEVRQVYLPPPQSLIGKQIRSEIDDKFCKFEIKKLLEGDETISIISDTWSTDVLASDSETIEQHDRANIPPILEQSVVEPVVQQMLDVSETTSESAWSTDVLASDSERMAEVDTDDTASVARSDDTARSEIDDGMPEQNSIPPPPSVSHNPFVSPVSLDNNRPSNPVNNHPQSPTVSYMFRPIKDDIPNSPTRNDFHQNFNVTGRGGRKSDYRRRTIEYVDSNANNIVHNSVLYSDNRTTVPASASITDRIIDNIERRIIRTSNIHNIENMASRREAILIDSNLLNSNGFQLLNDKKPTDSSNSDEVDFLSSNLDSSTNSTVATAPTCNNDIVMGAVAPAFLLANHVGAQKYIPKPKNENDVIRSSNASLNSMSSGSSSASESRNKIQSGINLEIQNEVRPQWNLEPKQWANNGSENSLNVTSTPSGSTSELSVLSSANVQLSPVNNISQRNNTSVIKPSSSTGAIPKSISFDMTAEKGDKDFDDDKKNNRGFFGKLRMGFRNRRGKSLRGVDDLNRYDATDGDGMRIRRMVDPSGTRSHISSINNETSEDILAKYRRKPSNTSDTNTTDSATSSIKSKGNEIEDDRLIIDPSNIEASFAFNDAKKKLRFVLSTSDVQFAPLESAKQGPDQNMNELVAFLQLQLARARNLKDWPLVARVSETLRCVRLFDDEGCRKLCFALKEDYCKRTLYNQYLLRCRQVLLSTRSYLDSLQLQITSERELSSTCLVAVCVRLFLERQESQVISFCEEFAQLKVSDEKTDALETFLQLLANDLEKDSIWHAASQIQLEQARIAIEHTVMSRVYLHALYPNGDADIYRDQVLSEHIRKLSRHITPSHKDLLIAKALQYECPWPCAQEALSVMAAYKTPRDKVRCVVRCATSIMDLLAMSSERSVPTADDFTPVLVYVIIRANPQSLLSTIQYVNCFYGNRLCGEEQYWWTQFCASVEFIKTMEYTD